MCTVIGEPFHSIIYFKKKFCIQAFSSGSKYRYIKGLIFSELFLGVEQSSVYR